jgi:DNA (cytosine-5)-methyltransferase 1
MRAISLFTGAGGLDIGCEAAGFSTYAVVESAHVARQTIQLNRTKYFRELRPSAIFHDITTLDFSALLSEARLHVGEVDLVHGGPPCTPFSKSGYWLEYKRAGADPRASLLDFFVHAVDQVKPKAVLMENVYGLAYRNQNRPVFERFKDGLRSCGYVLDHRILLAADFGVPQLRQRLICIAIRRDLLHKGLWERWRFKWPEPLYGGPHETRRTWNTHLPPHRTVAEALSTLEASANPPEPEEVVEGTYANELRAIPPGENYLFWTAERGHPSPRFKWRSRYWNFLLKLHPERPAPTIQGQPGPWVGPFHWDNRRIRTAEVKRLMTFPDDYVVSGSRREQQLQLGNAVPPVFAERIANAIAEELRSVGSGETTHVFAAA